MRIPLTRSENIVLTIKNNPPNVVSFMSAIVSTSGRLHSEFIRLLFLQVHRETDRFLPASGVQLSPSTKGGFFQFRHAAFSSMLKSHVSLILDKPVALRINLNLDGTPARLLSPLRHILTHHIRKLLVY